MAEPKLKVGNRVEVTGKDVVGTVAYIGTTQFSAGKWVGVVLDEPKGKNNGSVQGKRYFSCEENFGIFVRPTQLTLLDVQPDSITMDESVSSIISEQDSSELESLKRTASSTSLSSDTRLDPQRKPGVGLSKLKTHGLTSSTLSIKDASKTPRKTSYSGRSVADTKSSTSHEKPPLSQATSGSTPNLLQSPAKKNSLRGPSPTGKVMKSSPNSGSSPRNESPSRKMSESKLPSKISTSQTKPTFELGESTGSSGADVPISQGILTPNKVDTSVHKSDETPLHSKATYSQAHSEASSTPDSKITSRIPSSKPGTSVTETGNTPKKTTQKSSKSLPLSGSDQHSLPTLPTGSSSVITNPSDACGLHSPGTELEIINLNAEIKTLSDQVEALKIKREEDRAKLQELERVKIQITQMEENRRLMREQAAELQREVSQLKTEKAEVREAFDRYREEVAEMVESVEMATLDKEMAEEKVDTLTSEIELLKEQIEELTLENQILKEESEDKGNSFFIVTNQ